MMQLRPNPEYVRQRGVAAIQIWDAVEDRPSNITCRVTALLGQDLYPIARAVMHPGGVHGFLELAPNSYQLLVEPISPAYLPSMRTLEIPAPAPPPSPPALPPPPPPPVFLDVRLRPSPMYRRQAHSAVVRGTVQWDASKRPARWAGVFGWLAPASEPAPTPPAGATWTRTDARGEFALVLRHPPPNSDGALPAYKAWLEIHATTPPPATDLAADDFSDLVLDDGTDAEVYARQPPSTTISTLCMPDDELSLNSDSYPTTDPQTQVTLQHRVILLT